MRWQLRDAEPSDIERLTREAGLSPVIARLLAARGITTAEQAQEFLAPSLSHLHSPYLMAGLRAAVERLRAAIERGETVFIYGDYDVDGTTAIVILKAALEILRRQGGVPRTAPHPRRLRHARRGDRAGRRRRHSADHQR